MNIVPVETISNTNVAAMHSSELWATLCKNFKNYQTAANVFFVELK